MLKIMSVFILCVILGKILSHCISESGRRTTFCLDIVGLQPRPCFSYCHSSILQRLVETAVIEEIQMVFYIKQENP